MVSIVIVSFNTRSFTEKCLLSLKKYIDLKNNEVIVVDNGSEDGSVEMIKKEFKWVKLIKNNANLGFAKANNIGIKQAEGDYILLLNSDTELISKDSLNSLVAVVEWLPNVGAIVPKLLNTDKSPQMSVFHFPTLIGAIKQYWLGIEDNFGAYIPANENSKFKIRNSKLTAITVGAAVMAVMLIPRSTIEKVGLLDERYFMYFEDIDYCRFLKKAGLKVYYLPDVKVVHHLGKSGQSLKENKDQWRRLIPSSKLHHGWLKHYAIQFVLWSGQKAW